MAQLPSIASTAEQRVTPGATLQIGGVSPSAFGGGLGAGLQQLGDAGAQAGASIQQFQLAKQAEANRLSEFDRQTSFVAFGSDQATKLDQAKRDLSGPAQDFTKSFMGAFDTDASTFLSNVPERDRHAWQAKMQSLRSSMAGEALRSEFSQRDQYYKTTIADTLGHLQNGAMSTPEQLDGYRAQGEQIINASGLSAQDKATYAMQWKGQVTTAAAQGDVMRDPEGAIKRLGGLPKAALQGVMSPTSNDVASKIINVESGGDPNAQSKTSSASGLGQFTDATWLSLYKQKMGDGNLTDAQILAKKKDPELARQMTAFLVDANKAALGAKGLPATDANVYTLHFLGPDHGADLIRAPADTPVSSILPKSFIDANKSVLAGKTAGDVRDWAARKMGGDAAPPGPGQASATPNEAPAVDPRYADLPQDTRLQLIGSAQREIERKQSMTARAEQEAHSSWLNQFMNELNDGKAGVEDIEAARKSGTLTDFDEISRANNIVAQRNKAQADLNTYNTLAATPGFTWNPFDGQQTGAVEAAVKAAGGTPQAAFNVWQKTGILADSGAVALRGSMISTNPQQVSQGASIASNMLAANPNAFAGVKGGSDIEQGALMYGHLVNDLGYTPQDAAARVAQQNSPEVRHKIETNKPETQAFRTQILKTGVEGVLNKALGNWIPFTNSSFLSPEQRNVASQDYADIASDHFSRFGDAGAAEAYAAAQMKKLYGVVNGRLMKYPPTNAYPAVGGSQQYILNQAADDIKSVTGRAVDPSKVYLMPVPTATAEAFRAGKPVPYAVHYIDEVNGQQVYRVLNGKTFFADPGAEAKRVSDQRGSQFEAARQTQQSISNDARMRATARFGLSPDANNGAH